MNRKVNKSLGFTLLEMLIVMGLISIIAAVALPSYNSYIVRAQRSDGMDSLTEIMNQQQRYLTKNRTYTTDLQNLGYTNATYVTPEGGYTITATACGASIARCVLLTADAQGRQDGDGDITINSLGQKTFAGESGWQKR